MINARAETLAEKPSFKRLLKNRRCLVLARGFYEWRKKGKGKVPMWFKLKSGRTIRLCWLVGCMEEARRCMLRTYTIVTTEPNEVLAPIHNRMPAMLSDNEALEWVSGDEIAHAVSSVETVSRRLDGRL